MKKNLQSWLEDADINVTDYLKRDHTGQNIQTGPVLFIPHNINYDHKRPDVPYFSNFLKLGLKRLQAVVIRTVPIILLLKSILQIPDPMVLRLSLFSLHLFMCYKTLQVEELNSGEHNMLRSDKYSVFVNMLNLVGMFVDVFIFQNNVISP